MKISRGNIRLRFALAFALAAAFTLSSACSGGDSTSPASRQTLRLSMIPTTDPGKIIRDSQGFIEYLEKETGAEVDLTVPTNYAAVVEAVANDQVDIAYFGGFTYVQASARAGVQPLVQRTRDQEFHSFFITHAGTNIDSLDDLKGRSFAFGDVNSTSGHLMPEYFMREAKVDPEVISKAIYTGGHDATALAVANRKVDAGALDEAVFQKMVTEKKIDPAQVKVFYTTPPFFDYIWVARKGLDPRLSDAFSQALLKLDSNNPEHRPFLDLLGATKYVKAEDSDYSKLRQAAKEAGLMK